MHLQHALATFDAMQARYDLARTHLDLASLAHTQGNQDAATTHLSTAYAWFKKLQVPTLGRADGATRSGVWRDTR